MAEIAKPLFHLALVASFFGAAVALLGGLWRLEALVHLGRRVALGVALALTAALILLIHPLLAQSQPLTPASLMNLLFARPQGSFLLWCWLLAALTALFARASRHHLPQRVPLSLGLLLLFNAASLVAALWGDQVGEIADPGAPVLHDLTLALLRPPLILLGLSAMAMALAQALALLLAANSRLWAQEARPWLFLSWLALGSAVLISASAQSNWIPLWGWRQGEGGPPLAWLLCSALLLFLEAKRWSGPLRKIALLLMAGALALIVGGLLLPSPQASPGTWPPLIALDWPSALAKAMAQRALSILAVASALASVVIFLQSLRDALRGREPDLGDPAALAEARQGVLEEVWRGLCPTCGTELAAEAGPCPRCGREG